MKSIVSLGLLGLALFSVGCAAEGELDEELVSATDQALTVVTRKPALAVDNGVVKSNRLSAGVLSNQIEVRTGNTLFYPFTLTQGCKLTFRSVDGTDARTPVLGIIINNGSGHPYGSAIQPCNHAPLGSFQDTDGYSTLAMGEGTVANGYDPTVTWKNYDGGAARTVYVVGFLSGSSPSFGNLHFHYDITECADPTKNTISTGQVDQDMQASGKKAPLGSNVYTVAGPTAGASDPVLYELDPYLGGSAKCNDDCATSLTRQSCIANNSWGMWYFSRGIYSTGSTIVSD